jgi:phenol 2-monooxygenase
MSTQESAVEHVDVLVVGGGPVGMYDPENIAQSTALTAPGLITAYQLARNLPHPHKVKIVEKYPKSAQDNYGRAITL